MTLNSAGSATDAVAADETGPGDAPVTAGEAGGEVADAGPAAPDGEAGADRDGTEGGGETVEPHADAIAAAATASPAILAPILKQATGRRRTPDG
jgi:hypothetical protein